jgi:NAD(P)-dependent dehydrogenase (short-subunit alcohol dehydrogenase family)
MTGKSGDRKEDQLAPVMNEELRLDGKVVVVTGAGRGLGRSYALLLARRGAHVVVNDLGSTVTGDSSSADPATEVVEEIRAAGGSAIADASDVSEPAQAPGVVQLALDTFGGIDVVINNAGIFLGTRSFLEIPFPDFERLLRVHLRGTYNMCRSALLHYQKVGKGRILNTCSTQGAYGGPMSADYAAAKGAVQALTCSLAGEYRANPGIRINGIAPGGFTRMLEGFFDDPEANLRMKQLMAPDLAAPLVVWLCHENCTATGEIYEAFAGRVTKIIVGEPVGFVEAELTVEDVARRAHELSPDSAMTYPADAVEQSGWVLDRLSSASHERRHRE